MEVKKKMIFTLVASIKYVKENNEAEKIKKLEQ